MIKALGYSHTEFQPSKPGRLCRGRERWIEPFEDDTSPTLKRLTISGALFSDDSARDALRGLPHSAVETAQIIAALFPRRGMVAFMEDGHAADIPDAAEGVEAYEGFRAGGRSRELLVRWHAPVQGVREIRDVLADPNADRVRGFAVLNNPDDETAELIESLFLLVGMSTMDSPPARFQPAALDEVLKRCRAVVLLHRDKHGPALGIYSKDPVKTTGRLEGLCDKAGTLLVEFAIPPMLARWDRALAELRATWETEREEPFPVPRAPEPSSWEPRRRRRGRRDKDEAMAEAAPEPSNPQPASPPEAEAVTDTEDAPQVTATDEDLDQHLALETEGEE